MTVREVGALLVRLAGIVLALYALRSIPPLIRNWDAYQSDPWAWVSFTVLVVWIVAALCMIALPLTVAGNILGIQAKRTFAAEWRAADVQSAVIALMGLWLALGGALDGLYWIVYRITAFGVLAGPEYAGRLQNPPYSAEQIASMWTAAVQFVAGVLMMLQAGRIADLLARVRMAGNAREDS
jgi:hypothetical protein